MQLSMPLPQRLREREPLIGTLVTVDSPEIAEALALCGLHWLFIDAEHGPALTAGAVQRIAQAVAGRCYTLVRVAVNDEASIKKALDAGTDGVIVPHVRTAHEAQAAVLAAKYPPLGRRSVGLTRAHGYGMDFAGYIERANAITAVVVQIEDAEALEHLAQIVTVPGIDAVFVGPYDLSGSLGRLGDLANPELQAAIEEIRARCRSLDMPLGIFAGNAAAAASEIQRGAGFVAVGTDIGLMVGAARSTVDELAGANAEAVS